MKKFIILPILCLSASLFAGKYDEESFKTKNKWIEFKAIWDEISLEDYGLAFHHLKDIDVQDAETELQVQMFQMIIAMKVRNKQMENELKNDINEDLYYLCDCE